MLGKRRETTSLTRQDLAMPNYTALLIATVFVGAGLGWFGSHRNRAGPWDEVVCWIVASATTGTLLVAIAWLARVPAAAAAVWTSVWALCSIATSLLAPKMDQSKKSAVSALSIVLKWPNSPVTTTVGLIAATTGRLWGSRTQTCNGALFFDMGGRGAQALTLGAVIWTQGGVFESGGSVPSGLAQHESYHSRNVAVTGEIGFYLTYVTLGAIWGKAQGGTWNGLNPDGYGNPLEKTGWTYQGVPCSAAR